MIVSIGPLLLDPVLKLKSCFNSRKPASSEENTVEYLSFPYIPSKSVDVLVLLAKSEVSKGFALSKILYDPTVFLTGVIVQVYLTYLHSLTAQRGPLFHYTA